MRYFNDGVLLIVVAFLAAITVVSSLTPTANIVKATSIRSLRSNDATVENGRTDTEERVGFGGVSLNMEKLLNKLVKGTSSTDKAAIKAWLKSEVRPTDLFKTLRLHPGVAKLDDKNPELALWFRFAAAYRKKHGDQMLPDLEIYFMLLRQYPTKDVTSLLQSLKQTPGMKQLATSMEHSLSGSWIYTNLNLKTNPEDLFNTLRLKEAGSKLDEAPVFHQWLKYRSMKGNQWFDDLKMLELFRKTMPEENVATLLHLLRQTPRMKTHADKMQEFLFFESQSSHQLMLNVWLKAKERPEKVYNMLGLSNVAMSGYHDNAMVIQWLRYTKLFRDKTSNHAFSGIQTVHFLQRERPLLSDWDLATLFQVLKETPDLKRQAEDMQMYLFRSWVKLDCKPKSVAESLAIPYPVDVVSLPKSDPKHLTWEAFTLYFAENKGGEAMLRKVKEAFANGNPRGALTAAEKWN